MSNCNVKHARDYIKYGKLSAKYAFANGSLGSAIEFLRYTFFPTL